MNLTRKTELIDEQISQANGGNPANFDDWHHRTEVILRQVFGEDSHTLRKFNAVRYSPGIWTEYTDFTPYVASGVRDVVSILEAAKLELQIEAGA